VGNVSTNVYAKFCCAPLHIKKALGIFGEPVTTRTRIKEEQLEWLFGTHLLGPKINTIHKLVTSTEEIPVYE